MKILLTGSNGFLGSFLKHSLTRTNLDVDYLVNSSNIIQGNVSDNEIQCDISKKDDLQNVKTKYDLVIHLAGFSKVTNHEFHESPHQKINLNGTINLIDRLILNGTKRFIFLSTANLYKGDEEIFNESNKGIGINSYEKSKLLCENYLEDNKNSIQSIVIRAPLVYGKGAKSFFSKLRLLSSFPIPLPLKGFNEKRSYISIANLTSLIFFFIEKDWENLEKFCLINCSDDNDLSIVKLLELMKISQKKKLFIFKMKRSWIKKILKSIGMDKQYDFINTAHQLDISKIKKIGWSPPNTVKESLNSLFE